MTGSRWVVIWKGQDEAKLNQVVEKGAVGILSRFWDVPFHQDSFDAVEDIFFAAGFVQRFSFGLFLRPCFVICHSKLLAKT